MKSITITEAFFQLLVEYYSTLSLLCSFCYYFQGRRWSGRASIPQVSQIAALRLILYSPCAVHLGNLILELESQFRFLRRCGTDGNCTIILCIISVIFLAD